ncbi:MAG TPA: hypothetical protein VMU95_11170 [Trebonia sp.]|nr:hypothetical protein [Trebonia sp.]HUN32564.1 hypothetical protein [Trebonia sp.]
MSDIEERLRAALRARARDFTVTPDAWPGVLARRGRASTSVTVARRGWRQLMTPFAAAAVVAAVVVISLALRPVVLSGGGPPPRPSVPARPSAPASTRPYYLCTTPPVPPAAVRLAAPPAVAVVPLASLPDQVKHYAIDGAVPYSAIVHVSENLGGTEFSAYVWYARMSLIGGESKQHPQDAIFAAESYTTRTDGKPASGFQYDSVTTLASGHVVDAADGTSLLYPNNVDDMMRMGMASSRITTVTLSQKDDPPLSGAVLTFPGFADKVWMVVFPHSPSWPATLTFGDAAGKVVASGPWMGDDRNGPCTYLAINDDYEPPQDGHAFSMGGSLPVITSVTAVLPDGQQISGTITELAGNPYREWTVTYPIADANLTVRLVFRNAAGKTLGTLTTVPGKNPLPPPAKPWW